MARRHMTSSVATVARHLRSAALAAGVAGIAACGGGGGSEPGPASSSAWTPGVFAPASWFAGHCAVPRIGSGDIQGQTVDENNWLRSWSHDLYLWYDEIVDQNPALYETPAYFELMKTMATTPSGAPKDKFHFSMPTDEWESQSQSGISAGYGAMWSVVRATPPREVRVAYTEPGSPAAAASLARGDRVMVVDGVDLVHDSTAAGIDAVVAALFPDGPGSSHTFTISDAETGQDRIVTMTSVAVTLTPVPVVRTVETDSGNVGYILFNDHVATAERALIDAVHELSTANVSDLVLDLRYNSGGFLVIASQLAYMIAGRAATEGKPFESLRFNDKHRNVNPVTGQSLSPLPFTPTTVGLSAFPTGAPLPTLNLARVFVLTGASTCSASESIINGLNGVDVEVVQVGASTCGKPYGFYPADNCGTTYFSVQFQGANAKGFGAYDEGFAPSDQAGTNGATNPGCTIADDFERALGDTAEARFATAIDYRATGMCAVSNVQQAPASGIGRVPEVPIDARGGTVQKPLWLQNRIMLE
jgi:carboxyl-terminal processing protease